MNKVDLHVKQLMLRSPTIFPNRWSVLEHVFLHIGTGYGWTRQGTMASIYDKKQPMPESMNMGDLDDEARSLEEGLQRAKAFGVDESTVELHRQVELGMRRLQREYIAQHIDVYASSAIGGHAINARLLPSSLAAVPLGQVPATGKMDRDWALAADEVATKVLQFIGSQLDGRGDSLPASQTKHFGELQEQLRAAIVALEPVTQLRAGRERVARMFQEMMGKDKLRA